MLYIPLKNRPRNDLIKVKKIYTIKKGRYFNKENRNKLRYTDVDRADAFVVLSHVVRRKDVNKIDRAQ